MAEVSVTMPRDLTPEMLRAVRQNPLTSCDDKDEENRRIGWLLCAWDVLVENRTSGVSIPPKPFPAPGKWFPVDVTGTRPMREHAPGKWELAAWPSDGVAIPLATLPESMSRDEMLRYYSEYANMVAHEVLRYQKRIRDLEAALMAAGVPDPCGVEGHTK